MWMNKNKTKEKARIIELLNRLKNNDDLYPINPEGRTWEYHRVVDGKIIEK